MQTPHTKCRCRNCLQALLALAALTCQPKNQCRITVSISLRQTPFSFLHSCIVYSGPVVIDSADTDIYVAAAAISQKLPGLLCIKTKQATILCHNFVPEEMADCIVPLHCLTGCDANSARVNSLDIEEEAIEELFEFTRLVCGDKVSRTVGTR